MNIARGAGRRRRTGGLARRQPDDGPVVIGYDARSGSAAFAAETARVVTGAGRRALVLPRPLPTPYSRIAVRHLDAAAGVMVTASHNPPQDNGYKVYLGAGSAARQGGGAQIVPPVDAEIEAAIRPSARWPRCALGNAGELVGDDVVATYVTSRGGAGAGRPARASIAYTPLHGVGADVALAAFAAAGFAEPAVVAAAQARSGPGVSRRSRSRIRKSPAPWTCCSRSAADDRRRHRHRQRPGRRPMRGRGARCPGRASGWRMLRGDEFGMLLADHLMRRARRGLYATSIVSSSLLGRSALSAACRTPRP